MNISSDTATLRRCFGNEKAVSILATAGFSHADITLDDLVQKDSPWRRDDFLNTAHRLRHVADKCGICFHQAHAPYEFDWTDYQSGYQDAVSLVARSFEIAGVLGVDTIIVHPIHHFVYAQDAEKVWTINLQYYKELLPYAKQCGVRIALENMFQFDNEGLPTEDALSRGERFISAMEELNDSSIVACVDVGHVAMLGRRPGDLIRQLGHDRVKALHIHDNDAVLDRHTLPYLGNIDWDDVCKALAEIDYDGVFTFETMAFLARFDEDFIPIAVKWLHDMGMYLIAKVEKYRATGSGGCL